MATAFSGVVRLRFYRRIGCVAFAGLVSACSGGDTNPPSDNPTEEGGVVSTEFDSGESHEPEAAAPGNAGNDASLAEGSVAEAGIAEDVDGASAKNGDAS